MVTLVTLVWILHLPTMKHFQINRMYLYILSVFFSVYVELSSFQIFFQMVSNDFDNLIIAYKKYIF